MADPTPAPVAPAPKSGLWYKNGQFSKTATFASLCNIIVLATYVVQTWFVGAEIDLHVFKFSVPAFNIEDAAAILAILNGTYLGNNVIKAKTTPPDTGPTPPDGQ